MRKIKRILPAILSSVLLVVPVVAFAQVYWGNLTPEQAAQMGLAPQAQISEIIIRVIQWIMGIVGLICIIMIIYGGVTYATAAGNEERIELGKRVLLWAIIGLVIAILAFTLARTIVTAIIG